MHHEVLLALSGCPGSAVRESKESGLFEVIPDLPFISPSEVYMLNSVLKLGTYYMHLNEFISLHNAPSLALNPVNNKVSSMYLKALSSGIDRVLDVYRQKLVDVERKCISDPYLPLSHLRLEFQDFQFLLPALDACVKHIFKHEVHGCQILSYLYERCLCGIPVVQSAFERILAVCHGVFYKQLSSWMLHGLLFDLNGEFFIERVREPSSLHEANVDEDEESQLLSIQLQSALLLNQSSNVFRINHSLTPSYLPIRVTEKILFIGEAVHIFQSRKSSDDLVPLSGSGLREDQIRFSEMLSELQSQPVFHLRDVEKTIHVMRDAVAQHLWRLLVEESDLVGHLQTIKDIFLLGRGELFLTFVDLANSFMKLAPSRTTEHDVNVAFQQAMIKIGVEHEELVKQFKLTVTAPPSEMDKMPYLNKRKMQSWKFVGMKHTVSWPLHIIFTPTALNTYSCVFQFLLTLRRTQMALQQTWAVLMHLRSYVDSLQSVWQLRTLMGFFIDNLQYYVQVDVLETQFSIFIDKIRTTHDFETIKRAQEHFLAMLHSQLFFSQPDQMSHGLTESLERCLTEIFELCFSFSNIVQQFSEEPFMLTHETYTEIEQISTDFKRQSSLLFRILSSVKSHHTAPYLAQLLLRIDFNRFFSSTCTLAFHN